MNLARIATAIALPALLTGCPKSRASDAGPASEDAAASARDELLLRLDERAARLVDFELRGERCLERCDAVDAAAATLQRFSIQLRTPGYYRIELDGQAVITFDGKKLTTVNRALARHAVVDLEKAERGASATLPYQVLSPYLVEGWRAPLLGVPPAQLRTRLVDDPGGGAGKLTVLERMLSDEALDRVEYWYRLPRADFVRKRFVRKDATVARAIEVLEEHLHPRSGYAYPKRWQDRDASGAIASWVRLTEVRIDQGISMDAFQQQIPEGSTLAE